MFFPKSLSFPHFSTQISTSLSISSVFCPNCSAIYFFYSTRNVVRYTKTCVKPFPHSNPMIAIVLCHGWRREKICWCQDNGMKDGFATSWVHEGQALDKERESKGARSDTHVLSSGPTEFQPMRGVLIPPTKGGCYLPFMLVLGVHAKARISLPPRVIMPVAFAKIPFPFLTTCPRVRSGFS